MVGRKAASTLMIVFEVLMVLFVIYSYLQIAEKYASSETTNKINIAEDIKMMVDTLVGTPGDGTVQYPANVSKYSFILSSSSITVFIKGEGEQQIVTRQFFLPAGYTAFGTVEGKETFCLEKEKRRILLRECAPVNEAENFLPAFVAETEGPNFYGIPITGDRIVFVIDRSGSMELPAVWPLPEEVVLDKKVIQEIDVAEWQVKSMLQQLSDGKYFTIILFSDVVTDNMVFSKTFVELTPETRTKASKFVEGWKPFGGTDLHTALKKALAYEGADTVFLLSDGSPSVDVTEPAELLKKVRELNVGGTKINTVGTFVIKDDDPVPVRETKEKGKDLLEKLAAENGGVFVLPEE